VKWYYSNQGEAEGPVAEDILLHLIQTGKLPEDTLIWREGENAWQPAYKKLGLDPLNLPDFLARDPASDDVNLVPKSDSELPPQHNKKSMASRVVDIFMACMILLGAFLAFGRGCS